MPADLAVEEAHPTEPVVLVNIAREWDPALTDRDLYERSRRYWRCSPQRHPANYAMVVGDGIIREVYRIDGWHEVDMAAAELDPGRKGAAEPLPRHTRRQEFDGEIALHMRHYVGKSARHLLGQNPFRWLNC